MNHTITQEEFAKLVRGEIVVLANGNLALADIGFNQMMHEVKKASQSQNFPTYIPTDDEVTAAVNSR